MTGILENIPLAARLRHIAGTKWVTRRYLDMDRLDKPQEAGEALM